MKRIKAKNRSAQNTNKQVKNVDSAEENKKGKVQVS